MTSLLLLSIACAPDVDRPPVPQVPKPDVILIENHSDTGAITGPRVDVGTGLEAFEPLSHGDPLEMVHGAQGGWHLLVSARAWELSPPLTIEVLVDYAGERVSYTNRYVMPEPTGPDSAEQVGMYAILDVSGIDPEQTPPMVLDGETVTITVAVTDDGGQLVESACDVVAMEAPD